MTAASEITLRCNLHCPLMFSGKHPPHCKLGSSEMWQEMTPVKSPIDLLSVLLWLACCSNAQELFVVSLFRVLTRLRLSCVTMRPDRTHSLIRLLVLPVAWGQSFSCSTVSTESSVTSAPYCWDTGTSSALLYWESERTAHFNLQCMNFIQEEIGKTARILIQQRLYSWKISLGK